MTIQNDQEVLYDCLDYSVLTGCLQWEIADMQPVKGGKFITTFDSLACL